MAKIKQVSKTNHEWIVDCKKWRGEVLVGKYRHWCFKWDGLPIDNTCMEWPCGCYQDDCKHDMKWVGQRGPEVLMWRCKKCGKELS